MLPQAGRKRTHAIFGKTYPKKYWILAGSSEADLSSKNEMANNFAGSWTASFDASKTSLATSP